MFALLPPLLAGHSNASVYHSSMLMECIYGAIAAEEASGSDVPTKNSDFAKWINCKGRHVLGEDLGAILECESISTVHRQSAIGSISHDEGL